MEADRSRRILLHNTSYSYTSPYIVRPFSCRSARQDRSQDKDKTEELTIITHLCFLLAKAEPRREGNDKGTPSPLSLAATLTLAFEIPSWDQRWVNKAMSSHSERSAVDSTTLDNVQVPQNGDTNGVKEMNNSTTIDCENKTLKRVTSNQNVSSSSTDQQDNNPVNSDLGEGRESSSTASNATTTTSTATTSSEQQTAVVRWSETLASPNLPAFSPSIDSNKSPASTGFHGTGLSLSINRTRQLNRTTHRCVSVLHELTSLYAQFAVALNKAGQLLPSPTSAMNAAAEEAGLTAQLPILPLQESMLSWAKEKSKVARQIRACISPLMQNYLVTHNDTVNGIQQRYTQSRSTCSYARGRALNSHTKYAKTLRETEHLIGEVKNREGNVDEGTSGDPSNASAENTKSTPVRTPKRLETRLREALKDTKNYEAKYKLRVRWENDCVALCQRLEVMALDTLQRMEQDRLSVFVNALIKVLEAQKEALDAGVISLNREIQPVQNEEPADADGGKKRAHKFVKMLTGATNNSFLADDEPTSGVMDAETLGLPEELGVLRDKIRSRLAARRERMQLAKSLSLFFESVVKASTKLGQSLVQLMKKESLNFSESLHVAMGSCEGAHVLRLWDGMTKFFEAEAEGCFAMADSLRNIRAAKLDSVILYGEKAMKTTAENDDNAWKQLCESARAKTRAEEKYRQSSIETAKARERMLSLDSKSQIQEEKDGKDRMVVGKRMQKGFSNIVSLLPDGGDKAMKILGTGARVSHAQRGLKEADEKEAKEKQQFVAIVEAFAAASNMYKAESEHTVSRYETEEKEGWEDVRSSIESFAELAQKLLGTLQLESISDLEPIAAQSHGGIVADINDWRMRAQQELVAICVDCTVADESVDSGFQLEVRLPPSRAAVEAYMESSGTVVDSKDISDDASIDEELDDDDTEEGNTESSDGVVPAEQNSKQTEDMANVKALFRRSVVSSQVAVGNKRGNVKKARNREKTGSDHKDPETDLFLTYFWPEPVDVKTVPMVVDSFPCTFRDGAQQLPFQYGRVYVSASRLIFVSWTKKKLNLKWEEVKDVKSRKSFDQRGDNAMQIVCKRLEAVDESCMILDGLYDRQTAIDVVSKLREEAKAAAAAVSTPAVPSSKAITRGPTVTPDETIQKMKVVVSKRLRKISIQRFHQIVWSEKEKALYQPWLEKEAFDVNMGDWKACNSVGPWCKETYSEERLIKFRVKRKTHLYIGPPIANVVQTHRCRLEGNDKCIVSMTIEFEGIPYSDTFAVEVRWVALRDGEDDVKLECGLFVDFKKKTFLKSKIQSGTLEESTPVHKSFFATLQAACVEAGGMEAAEEVEEEPTVEKPKAKKEVSLEARLSKLMSENPNMIHIAAVVLGFFLILLWRFFFRSAPVAAVPPELISILIERIETLEAKLDAVQSSMDELLNATRLSAE